MQLSATASRRSHDCVRLSTSLSFNRSAFSECAPWRELYLRQFCAVSKGKLRAAVRAAEQVVARAPLHGADHSRAPSRGSGRDRTSCGCSWPNVLVRDDRLSSSGTRTRLVLHRAHARARRSGSPHQSGGHLLSRRAGRRSTVQTAHTVIENCLASSPCYG